MVDAPAATTAIAVGTEREPLLPYCDVVVAHGGSGTVLATLSTAHPSCCGPRGANQFDNAERCAALGVGIRLLPGQVSAAALRSNVRGLFDDPGTRPSGVGGRGYRRGAVPGQGRPVLEGLATGRSGGPVRLEVGVEVFH